MIFKIEYARKRGEEIVVTAEKEVETDRLSIGSNEDNDIVLDDIRVTESHSFIQLKSNRLKITSSTDEFNNIEINHTFVNDQFIRSGDVIRLGNFEITIKSVDLDKNEVALIVETKTVSKSAAESLKKRSIISLKEAQLSKRKSARNYFIIMFLFFFIIPLVAFFIPDAAKLVRSVPIIPSDNSWTSGQLTSIHHVVGKDCNACHKEAFTLIQDKECTECHAKVLEHIPHDVSKENNILEVRCATCHKEHDGMGASLVNSNDQLCSSCHATMSSEHSKFEYLDFKDFDEGHPEFKVVLPLYDDNKVALTRKIIANNGVPVNLEEQSNLNFSHFGHLNKEGITGSKGKKVVMQCYDCHEPTESKALFRPIEMEKHCQSCHVLNFESDDPMRQVPHGNVDDVLSMLKEYYSNRAITGNYPSTEAPDVVQRERPGNQVISGQDKLLINEWVDLKASDVSEEIYYFTSCTTCHILKEDEDNSSLEVLPVNILPVRFPKGNFFVHNRHDNIDCETCHYKEVDTDSNLKDKMLDSVLPSISSSDVLMPHIKDCKNCHSSHVAPSKIESSCISCHGFHTVEGHIMGNNKAMADTKEL